MGSFAYFDDWSHKLLQKPSDHQQRRPEVVDEIDDQTLDVTAIVILVSHDHDRSISQARNVIVLLANLEPDNLTEILNQCSKSISLKFSKNHLLIGGMSPESIIILSLDEPIT